MSKLEELFQHSEQTVRAMFADLGEIMPMWHMQSEGGQDYLLSTPFGDNEEKEITLKVIKRFITEKKVVRFVFISEAWMKSYPVAQNPSKLERPVSEEPDRKEVINLVAEDRDSAESIMGFIPIDRTTGSPVLGVTDKVVSPKGGGGRFQNMFEIIKH